MAEQLFTPLINLELVRTNTMKPDQIYITQSPSLQAAKRRKSKLMSNRRTNEQIIQQSHEELLRYVDTVDIKVQSIIQTYEAQFLGAYRQHVKKVRQEMEQFKKLSMNNANSEQMHLEKIQSLEKQLIIFREQSLKLFEKIIKKDKEIDQLNMKIKELQNNNKEYEKNIYFLAKTNKQLEVAVEKFKIKNGEEGGQPLNKSSRSEYKRNQVSTPIKHIVEFDDFRPYTSRSKGNSLNLKLQSNKKDDNQHINTLKKKLEDKIGSNLVNIDTVIKIISQKQEISDTKRPLFDYRKARSNVLSKIQKRKSSFRVIENDIIKLKVNEIAEKNEYSTIFKNCVDEVKKQIIRRNNIPSLNFFKQNGPKNLIQFKKVDYFAILQLLLKNEPILKRLYNIIFNQE